MPPSLVLYHLNPHRATPSNEAFIFRFHILALRVMASTLPGEASPLIAVILTSASWNSSMEVSKELPVECGACVLTYEARV